MPAQDSKREPLRVSAPRLVVAGLSGDSGKTVVAIGLARALADDGLSVAPVKKGPDYIDAAWLGRAARRPGRNLDTFLMSDASVDEGLRRALPADVLVVEGNRGLFDGFDAGGSHSTAELAKRLRAPVLLVVDVTKMTRTTAAIVQGCTIFDPDLHIAGVVLNFVATARQEKVIRDAIASVDGPPVLGAIPRQKNSLLPGRHLGLVTASEHADAERAIERAAELVRQHVDMAALRARMDELSVPLELESIGTVEPGSPVRIGVFRDRAFSFYYPENLESLEARGAELVEISPVEDEVLPEVDGVYIGGGFPEEHAELLSRNAALRGALGEAADEGLPIYAECGGLMYLAREIVLGEARHPMAGVLDLVVDQTKRPQGHGYEVLEIDRENAFHPLGTTLRGHEFHYSHVVGGGDAARGVGHVSRGTGLGGGRDGLVKDHVWASYLHVHALGEATWADGFLRLARERRARRGGGAQAAWA